MSDEDIDARTRAREEALRAAEQKPAIGAESVCGQFSRTNPPSEFYVYAHLRANDLSAFYIGKGKGIRAWWLGSRTPHWTNTAKKNGCVAAITHHPSPITHHGLNEEDAFALEILLIGSIGRENLTNMTDGGDGQSNPSQETRDKISRGSKGRVLSEAARKAISAAHKGKKVSPATKKKMSSAMKGNKNSLGKLKTEAQRKRLSEIRKGMRFTDEHRRNLSIAHIGCKSAVGHVVPAWLRQKLSALHKGNAYAKGHSVSEASRKVMSEKAKAAWARRKAAAQ